MRKLEKMINKTSFKIINIFKLFFKIIVLKEKIIRKDKGPMQENTKKCRVALNQLIDMIYNERSTKKS